MNGKQFFIVLFLVPIFSVQAQKTTNALLSEGNRAFEHKNYAKSIERYTQAIEKDANSFEGAFNLGNALYKTGRYDEANEMYERALKNAKTNEDIGAVYYNKGNAFAKKGEWQKAAEQYKKSIEKNPFDVNAQKNYQIAKKKIEQQQNNSEQNKSSQKNGDSKKNDESQKGQEQQNDGKSPQNNGSVGNQKGKGNDKNGLSKGENDAQSPAIPENTKSKILQALSEREKETQRRILNKQSYSEPQSNEKDW